MANQSMARTNMVDSQIHTMGVISAPVLAAFGAVPREDFVPEGAKGIAYADDDLPLGQGRFLMEPSVLARMVEAAGVGPEDVVFNIGDFTGYSSAILARLAGRVVTPDEPQNDVAYSLILLNGAVERVPEQILEMLADKGRVVAIIRPAGVPLGTAMLIERIGVADYSTRKLFESGTPYIPGFEPRAKFSF